MLKTELRDSVAHKSFGQVVHTQANVSWFRSAQTALMPYISKYMLQIKTYQDLYFYHSKLASCLIYAWALPAHPYNA